MSGSPPPVDVLAPEGWAHDGNGEITEGKPQSTGGFVAAPFKHSRELQAQDVLRTKVVEGRNARVGFATESYDVEKHGETIESTAWVNLFNGTTVIRSDISQDGEQHVHNYHLKDYMVKREGGTGSTWGMHWGTRSRGIHLGGEETVIAAARVPPLHCAVRVLTADWTQTCSSANSRGIRL